jgi:hypothetical protein
MLAGHNPDGPSPPSPLLLELTETPGILKRRDYHIGATALREVSHQRREEPPCHMSTIESSVQCEILPPIDVSFSESSGKVWRVGQNEVEPTESRGQVGSKSCYRQAFVAGAFVHRSQRGRIQIGGHDEPSSASRRTDCGEPATAAYLENEVAGSRSGEPCQQSRVFPHGIDRLGADRPIPCHARRSSHRRAPKRL